MYANLEDLTLAIGEDRLLRIADHDDDLVIDADVVAGALLDASAEIDASVSKRYVLPLSEVPRFLKRIAIDIAHYHIDLDPTDDLGKRADRARAALKQIAKGDITLDDADLIAAGLDVQTGGDNISEAAVKPFQSTLDMGGF